MMTNQPQKFGVLLRRYRHRARPRFTQKDLAKKAGYSENYISMLERGERDPSITIAEMLSEAMNLSQEDRTELISSLDARHPTESHIDWREVPDLKQFYGRQAECSELKA